MKFIKLLFVIFITLPSPVKADLNENLINKINNSGNLIFIRHAFAPGMGDPSNFDINDCKTQRNLNTRGREQAKKIRKYFSTKQIPISKVISSEWCRCQETALLSFGNFETKSFLNSFYSSKFKKNKNKQIKDLKEYVRKWGNDKNLVFVTHYVVINEVLGYAPSSGEIVISNINFEKITSVKVDY